MGERRMQFSKEAINFFFLLESGHTPSYKKGVKKKVFFYKLILFIIKH